MEKIKNLLTNAIRINKFAWKHKKSFLLLTLVLAVINSFISYANSGVNALLINHLTDSVGTKVIDEYLLLLALAAALLYFVPDIISSLRNWSDKHIFIDLSHSFLLSFLKKKSEIDIQTYENPKFQDILNKAEERGVNPIVNFNELQYYAIGNIVSVLLGLAVLLFFNWKICILVLAAIVPEFIVQIKFNDEKWGIFDLETKERRRYQNSLQHFRVKNYFTELKLFQNVNYFFHKIKKIMEEFTNSQQGVQKKQLIYEIGSSVLSGGIVAGVVFWVIYQVVEGNTQVGTFLFVISSIEKLQSSLITFLSRVARLHEHNLYITDVFKVMDTPPALPRAKHPTHLDGTTPEIIFENVSFSYPEKEALTLKNISLTINAGEKFALVGENGAGKTTFVKLLCRIYDPTEGRILINGTDLRQIELESWYKTLGILFQEYAPYKFEVKETIALGRSDDPFDMERITTAALASESDSFIQKWPDKYDQQLGTEFDKGLDPSKGQQQRLAIARLLHRRAGVLILDEPTASIDAEAEKKIFDQIEKEAKNQTVILISHKYSTVRNAHRICVFKDNIIHELGSHEELMKKDGTYAKLFKEQAEGYITH